MKITFLALAGVLVLAGCGHDITTKTTTETATAPVISAEEKMSDDTMVHEKDMTVPHIVIQDQKVEDGVVVITGVNMFADGWIVIHNVVDGEPGMVVGHAPVKKGGDTHIAVNIDTEQATPELIAMAHVDAGTIGTYEFPGTDVPLKVDGNIVMEKFMTGENFSPVADAGTMEDEQMMEKEITLTEIAQHARKEDCWFAVGDKVYDVTPFIAKGIHPGGEAILEGCGKDATMLYETRPMGSGTPHSAKARESLEQFEIGILAQ